jgi:nitrate/nitrite-specific signal transduction histidine kinase
MSSTKRWSASGSSVPVLLIGATIGGYWISRRALQPVDQITAAVELISIRSLSERLNVPNTADELQRLSETLNRMLARLNSSVHPADVPVHCRRLSRVARAFIVDPYDG